MSMEVIAQFNSFLLAAQTGDAIAELASAGAMVSAVKALVASLVYSVLGLVMFGLAYKVLGLILPFSIRKELEEDQNTAVGIVLGCMMLGLAIIIAAAIHG